MKKILIIILISLGFRFQAQVPWIANGNPPAPLLIGITPANNFLGTDASNNLKIKLGTGGIPHFQIEDNSGPASQWGKVSLFDNTPPGAFTPRARLNIYQSSGLADLRLTTGARLSLNEGMLMYYDNSNDRAYLGNLTATPGANLDLGAGMSSVLGAPPARLTCFGSNASPSVLNNLGGVAIHWDSGVAIDEPGSLLHIGNKFNSTLAGLQGKQGWRDWMSVGTFNFAGGVKCAGDAGNSGGGIGTDNMYVGLLYSGGCPNNPNAGPPATDRYDAVIAWGDDEGPGSVAPLAGPDYLRVIFNGSYTGAGNADNAGSYIGREVMRFDPNSKVGIGNYQNGINVVTNQPARRLEVLTDFIGLPNGEPQFRLTYNQQNPTNAVITGRFTDFNATQNGDLNIDPRNNTIGNPFLKDRFVGIHTNTPGNSLEINSQLVNSSTANGATPAVGFGVPTGKAGLRFSDLTSTSTVQANPGPGLLSVDNNGDVIYVPGGSAVASNNGVFNNGGILQLGITCAFTSVAQKIANGLTADRVISLNGNNLIFGDGGNVGIGFPLAGPGMNCTAGNRLEIKDNRLTSATQSNTNIPGTFGSSGLRLTYLTSATPVAPSNGKLLTVNANGDVVLVADQTGTVAAGSVFAQNGLTLLGTNTVVLGGTLLNTTQIDFAGFSLLYKNATVDHYQRAPTGGVWQFADGPNNKDGQSCFTDHAIVGGGISVGRRLNAVPSATSVGAGGLIGELVTAIGTATSTGGGITG